MLSLIIWDLALPPPIGRLVLGQSLRRIHAAK